MQRSTISSPHFSRRDLELHHLPALREHEAGRVEDVPAWRGHLAGGELLARRARPPCVALQELHMGRLPDHGQREYGEQRVHNLDATRANHGRGLGAAAEGNKMTWSGEGTCMLSRCSAIGANRARLEASRISPSSFTRSASSA